MAKEYAILPCNGLDKQEGCLTRELALQIKEQTSSEIICPTFFRVSDDRYKKLAGDRALLVIDGCGTRCASKLAAEKGLRIAAKINIAEESKKHKIKLGSSLRPAEGELFLCNLINQEFFQDITGDSTQMETERMVLPDEISYETCNKDKFIFRVPMEEGFYFNENDCWAYVKGNKARIGVTDFVQKSLSDIMFFSPPALGDEIEQFSEAGCLESGKAVFEIICPVTGIITAVNNELTDHPEYVNDNPYEKGWIAELELTDWESDQGLLLKFNDYIQILQRKVDEFHAQQG